ncbi:MAG TPA: hypothetical protein VFZ56_05230 [Gemmatimonadaceae bacterium]
MTANTVDRDERTVAVENASYRAAYLFLSYGLLGITAYRGFVREESAWDLLALVILGGVVAAVYQGRERILTRRWSLTSVAAVVVALVLALLLVLFRSQAR